MGGFVFLYQVKNEKFKAYRVYFEITLLDLFPPWVYYFIVREKQKKKKNYSGWKKMGKKVIGTENMIEKDMVVQVGRPQAVCLWRFHTFLNFAA